MENKSIMEMREDILRNVRCTFGEVQKFVEKFGEYKYIWTTDKQICLQYFAKCGRVLMQSSPDSASGTLNAFKNQVRGVIRNRPNVTAQIENAVVEAKPTLSMFKDQIERWLNNYESIDSLCPEQHTFSTWLRLDLRSFKQILLNECCKWRHIFQQYMHDHLTDSLQELERFIDFSMATLSLPVSLADFRSLLDIMSVVKQIEQRQHNVENCFFEALREELLMLRNYNVELDTAVTVKVSVLRFGRVWGCILLTFKLCSFQSCLTNGKFF